MRPLLTLILLFNCLFLSAQTAISCFQVLSGEVRDKITNILLPGAEVMLSDKGGTIIESQIVNDNGRFVFKIQCITEYYLEGKKEQYTPESKLFIASNEPDKVLNLMVLLGKGDIDFIAESNLSEQGGKGVKIDSVASSLPKEIEQPVVEAIMEEVLPKEILKSHGDGYIPNIDPIYFDFGSSYLDKKAKKDLLKIVDLMNSNSNIKIESTSHTDAKGPSNYNIWLSQRRAKRAIDFIVSKGIDPDRIVKSKGYGDAYLINNCNKKVDCSEPEHAKNRRTEFVIVKM